MDSIPGDVDMVLIICHNIQHFMKCHHPHSPDVQIGDGGGQMTCPKQSFNVRNVSCNVQPDETESSKISIITSLMRT